jgi:riboflavin transporter FmnP
MYNQPKPNLTRELTIYGALAAFSAVAQVFHFGYQTPWGMWIDVVGVSWIMAYFLFGLRGGISVATVGAILIALVAPETWLGSLAKYLATVPLILIFHGFSQALKVKREDFGQVKNLILPTVASIIVRGVLMFFFNYYFALQIWIPGNTPQELMAIVPPYIIVGVNAVQTVLDIGLAWALVYPGKLIRFKS